MKVSVPPVTMDTALSVTLVAESSAAPAGAASNPKESTSDAAARAATSMLLKFMSRPLRRVRRTMSPIQKRTM